MAKSTRRRGLTVRVQQLPHAEGLPLPAYQTAQSAGLDLMAAVPATHPVRLRPGASALIETGLVLELPAGTEGQVRPRSGLAARHAVTVLNSPGTIDADYRGEVKVILINLGQKPFKVARGERIAQLVVAPVIQARLRVVAAVSETGRGSGGFGSTGTSAAARSRGGRTKKKSMPKRLASTKRAARKPAAERRGGARRRQLAK